MCWVIDLLLLEFEAGVLMKLMMRGGITYCRYANCNVIALFEYRYS